MRALLIASAFVLTAMSPAFAEGGPAYSTAETTIGDLLDNPETHAVLEKHVPDLIANPQLEMARGMTFVQVQPMAAGAITDEMLAEIDADLAKIDGETAAGE